MSVFDPSVDTSAAEGIDTDKALQAPSTALPKSGGAIRGMGERFGVDPVTSTGSPVAGLVP